VLPAQQTSGWLMTSWRLRQGRVPVLRIPTDTRVSCGQAWAWHSTEQSEDGLSNPVHIGNRQAKHYYWDYHEESGTEVCTQSTTYLSCVQGCRDGVCQKSEAWHSRDDIEDEAAVGRVVL
jgi:hypothetical protein